MHPPRKSSPYHPSCHLPLACFVNRLRPRVRPRDSYLPFHLVTAATFVTPLSFSRKRKRGRPFYGFTRVLWPMKNAKNVQRVFLLSFSLHMTDARRESFSVSAHISRTKLYILDEGREPRQWRHPHGRFFNTPYFCIHLFKTSQPLSHLQTTCFRSPRGKGHLNARPRWVWRKHTVRLCFCSSKIRLWCIDMELAKKKA